MLRAILQGKLSRDIEGMEDVLTSCAFGVLALARPLACLLPFLARSEGLDGFRPLQFLESSAVDSLSIEYWQPWKEPGCDFCEPDVVIRLDAPEGRRLLILVEAKFRSGKSSTGSAEATSPRDQLAREWANLRLVAKREAREPHLVYLTADVVAPATDINDAKSDFRRYHPGESFDCLWLGWQHLPDCINLQRCETKREATALAELSQLLERLGLLVPDFGGFTIPAWPLKDVWGFTA